ncbi:MAG TPA: hypothetical protein PK413_15355 [Thermoanaerobaculia bacterium]|nr:hypothetical protein [Thermoanaerobaculia bacterium]
MNQGEIAGHLGMHKGSVELLEQSGHAGLRLRAVFEKYVRG